MRFPIGKENSLAGYQMRGYGWDWFRMSAFGGLP
jgi:hypothetical protein